MKIQKFEIEGLLLIDSQLFEDARGFFTERFNVAKFKQAGLPTTFIQDNFSRSLPGVLRGLHYQHIDPQGKLVTCLSGRIFDVAVDIRSESPTFGKYLSVELSGDRPQWLWIPPGFAHGFCVLGSNSADVLYKVDRPWNPAGEDGLHYADPEVNIAWPVANPVLIDKDKLLPSFATYRNETRF